MVLCPDPSLVSLNNAPCHGQPYSHTLLLDGEESIKHFGQFSGEVLGPELETIAEDPPFNSMRPITARPNRLHAVDNQIQDHVLQLNSVTLDCQRLRDTNQKN